MPPRASCRGYSLTGVTSYYLNDAATHHNSSYTTKVRSIPTYGYFADFSFCSFARRNPCNSHMSLELLPFNLPGWPAAMLYSNWCRPLTVRGFTIRRLRPFTPWGVPSFPTLQSYEYFLKRPNLASRMRARNIIYAYFGQ